jgi:TPR repeat protein
MPRLTRVNAALAALLAACWLAPPAAADFEAGYAAYQRGDFATALAEWQPLAEAGDPKAQFNLGVLYDEGKGVVRSRAMTIAWWEKAAAQRMPLALHNLAHLYLGGGDGASPDYDKAREYLELATKLGLPRSQYTLGKMYEYGLGSPRDDAKAAELYKMAAERGFDRAQYNLGKMYRDGRGLPRDPVASVRWFRAAAEQGYAKAQSHLGRRLAKGEGTQRDDVEAYKWTALAAEQGIKAARENLAVLKARMSDEQIAEGERLKSAFKPTQALR